MKIAGIILAIIAVFIGISIATSSDEATNNADKSLVSNHVIGESPLNVTLVEAADFECPACSSFHPLLKQIKAEYSDRVVFQFSHFPILELHPNALSAHRAAEAASKQGKFWEMHDLLFEQRDLWVSTTTSSPISQLDNFAEQLELNMDQYRADFASAEVNNIINADVAELKEKDVAGTPTFFINDQKFDSQSLGTIDSLRQALDDALAEAAGDTSDTDATDDTPTDEAQTTSDNN